LHKCWHIDNFLALAKELISRDIKVIFLLGPAESERFSAAKLKKINSITRSLTDLPLTMVCGLLSCADWYLGNDSGITHLAAGLGVKTIAIFGPTNPVVYRPIGPAVTVFESGAAGFAEEASAALQEKICEVLTA
jgi:ADP-heptose:LPS heptosyltransferase